MSEPTERPADGAAPPTADGAAPEQPANGAAGRERRRPHVAIITGLSGAGKTQASKLLEDEGYSVVDNLPSELLRDLAELAARDHARFERLALVLDARAGNAPHVLGAALAALEARGIDPQVFFLEARDEILIRRFSETRRPHPLDEHEQGVGSAIARERELLSDIRAEADVVIDTSDLSGRQLRERIRSALSMPRSPGRIALNLISFGYKHGVPLEADMVFDVRFMENPFYKEGMRTLTGLDEPVRTFVLQQPITRRFLRFVREFLTFTLPAYEAEGKSRLTVAVGCTGGNHRSVAIAEAMATQWRASSGGPVSVWHRELEKT